MMAISKSDRSARQQEAPGQAPTSRVATPGYRPRHHLPTWLFCLALVILPFLRSHAQNAATSEERDKRYYRTLYHEGKKRCDKETNNVETAWIFAQACFDWADFATTDSDRAEVAQEGIAAARRAIALEPQCGPAYHYLALNLGQLARTKLLGALKLLGEMEGAWKQSIALDPNFRFASAHRSLGMLYRDAPGWPTSLGDRSKARTHLKKAVELAPSYPDNQLTLIETYLDWGDKKAAAPLIAGFESITKTAREQLTGEQWNLSWREWQQRWEKIKARTKSSRSSARSPRGGQ